MQATHTEGFPTAVSCIPEVVESSSQTGVDEVMLDVNKSNDSETLFEIHYSEDNDIRETIYKIVQSNGWSLLEIRSASTTLEQFFSELVGYGSNSLNDSLDLSDSDESMS